MKFSKAPGSLPRTPLGAYSAPQTPSWGKAVLCTACLARQYLPSIDLLPNYGPGTSKRYRKPVTTGNTVISNCEKRNFRRSSDLAEAEIYLFAVLVIFDMPSTNHFFWSFCSQVGITMVLEGFSGVFIFGLSALLYRDFENVSDGLDLSKSGRSFVAA